MEFNLNKSLDSKDAEQSNKTNVSRERKPDSAERSESECEEDSNNSLQSEIEQRLQVGSIFHTLDAVYVLYCEYARLMGFSVKKGSQSYFINSLDVRMKAYHCSCEGHPDGKRYNEKIPSYRKQITRTDCKARLRVTREEIGPWTVSIFYNSHNHELLPPDQSYLLRSARNLSHAKKSIVESLRDAGIGVSKAFRFMEKEAGGVQNIGFTKKDAYDHLRKIRMKSNLPDNDALELVTFFRKKQNMEPFFYWDVDVDDDGRLLNFFFRDTRSATDYEYFGDVMSVDATYRTNKYNLFCVPFVGINHHTRNVMYGLGFLSDESTESFNWLLRTFLTSMYDKEPEVIFTDQCKALMNAVDTNFKTASHRLCQWHINRNAATKFSSLNLDNNFKKLWEVCMNGCESEDEFNETWKHMMENYKLVANGWFKHMHTLRRRWASVFTNDKFTAGMHATSRSEVTNKVLKDLCASSAALHEFVMHYERIQSEWRTTESEEDALCRGRPGQFLHSNKLLTYAANIYTRSVFKIFECEAAHTLDVTITEHPPNINASNLNYKMKSSSTSQKIRTVNLCRINNLATCTCRMFETKGVICRHILNLYFYLSIEKLPEDLILHRWTKNAKCRFGKDDIFAPKFGRPQFVSNLAFVNRWMRIVYDMLYDCKDDSIYNEICRNHLQQMVDEISVKRGCDPPRYKKYRFSHPKQRKCFRDPPPPSGRSHPAKRVRKQVEKPTDGGSQRATTETTPPPSSSQHTFSTSYVDPSQEHVTKSSQLRDEEMEDSFKYDSSRCEFSESTCGNREETFT